MKQIQAADEGLPVLFFCYNSLQNLMRAVFTILLQ